jgi:pimeloyl-ACP methyl ester carboxylesterase
MKTTIDGRELEYVEQGSGPAVVFCSPTWWALDAWLLHGIPELAPHFRAIAFNQRGVGASAGAGESYNIPMLADDTLALLDALGIERAAFVGFANGNSVAVRIAEIAPQRVSALVLGAVSGGSPRGVASPRPAEAAEIAKHGYLPYIEHHALNDTFAFSPETHRLHPERPRALAKALCEHAATEDEFLKHVDARRGYDALAAAARVTAPTFALVGADDNVARGTSNPVVATEKTAATIPGAQLLVVPKIRHMLFWEDPPAVWPPVVAFLQEFAGGRSA